MCVMHILHHIWEQGWHSGESSRLPPMWPGLGVICGLSLLLILVPAPGTLVFLPLQKPSFPNSNSTWKQWSKSHSMDSTEIPIYLFYFLFTCMYTFSCFFQVCWRYFKTIMPSWTRFRSVWKLIWSPNVLSFQGKSCSQLQLVTLKWKQKVPQLRSEVLTLAKCFNLVLNLLQVINRFG